MSTLDSAKDLEDSDLNIIPNSKLVQINELVVHQVHGVGRFKGFTTVGTGRIKQECIKIEYKAKEYLYLKISDVNLIKKYGSYHAELDKLGGGSYGKRQIATLKKINDVAQDIIQNAKNRAKIKGLDVNTDVGKYNSLVSSFEYTATSDQARIVDQIKRDVERGRLFDRLVCGDTGSGKTEIAIRAAAMFVFAQPKYSVIIITPTTILCRQHYESFVSRFERFGIKVAELSRNNNMKDLKGQINEGKFDILICTHAVLQGVSCPNLGLVIIDEEHKFGVKQKEQLKAMSSKTNLLSLSATPIPRTLQMALSGTRSFSALNSIPQDRLSVKTKLDVYCENTMIELLKQEKNRCGKSFVVVPYISDIGKYTSVLEENGLRAVTLTGQMSAEDIRHKIQQFSASNIEDQTKNIDVLLCTPIIESGIHIPISNTIIILHAEKFGLSQLYQLRGRVGRSNVQGYACIFVSPGPNSHKTMERLAIMRSIDYLNAGFEIANFDMQTRGFGNLLGKNQSGHIKSIGIETYQEALALCMRNSNSINQASVRVHPQIALDISLYIPNEYIQDTNIKIIYYNKMAELFGQPREACEKLKDEMISNFGPLPQPIENIIETFYLKTICDKVGITKLEETSSQYNISFNISSNLKINLPSSIESLNLTHEVNDQDNKSGTEEHANEVHGTRNAIESLTIEDLCSKLKYKYPNTFQAKSYSQMSVDKSKLFALIEKELSFKSNKDNTQALKRLEKFKKLGVYPALTLCEILIEFVQCPQTN